MVAERELRVAKEKVTRLKEEASARRLAQYASTPSFQVTDEFYEKNPGLRETHARIREERAAARAARAAASGENDEARNKEKYLKYKNKYLQLKNN
jgi:hypothetical protein